MKENTQKIKCKNCDNEFEGNYCPECGQTRKNFDKPFKFFFIDFMGNIFAFDTRLWQTLKAVLFKPGRLTKDYMEGKRVRYMPPFRFYIFISFVFFLMLNFQTRRQITGEGIRVEADTTESGDVNFNIIGFGDKKDRNTMKLEDVLKENDSIKDEFTKAVKEFSDENITNNDSTEFNKEKETAKESDVDIKHIIEHPEIYIERFFKYSSWSLFLLMPVFGLLLLLFFRKTYKHYIAHLIFALNQHAFLFVLLVIILAVKMIFPEKEIFPENKLILLSPVYLLLGAKKLYKRNWFRTFFSLLVSVFIYGLIIIPIIILALMLTINLI